jgi:hypothetical protein
MLSGTAGAASGGSQGAVQGVPGAGLAVEGRTLHGAGHGGVLPGVAGINDREGAFVATCAVAARPLHHTSVAPNRNYEVITGFDLMNRTIFNARASGRSSVTQCVTPSSHLNR